MENNRAVTKLCQFISGLHRLIVELTLLILLLIGVYKVIRTEWP